MGKTQTLKLNKSDDISGLLHDNKNNLNAGLKRTVIDTNGGVTLRFRVIKHSSI